MAVLFGTVKHTDAIAMHLRVKKMVVLLIMGRIEIAYMQSLRMDLIEEADGLAKSGRKCDHD